MLKSLFRKRDPAAPGDPVAEAKALSGQGRHEEAQALLATHLAAQPSDARALRASGAVALERARTDEAIGFLEHALRVEPQSAEALASYGMALLAQGRGHEALARFAASLALDPAQPSVLVSQGDVLHAIGQQQQALAAFDAALACDPESARAHGGRGRVLAQLGRAGDAVAAFDRAIEVDPFFVDAFINRGNAHHALGREDQALMDYDTALQFAPDSADAWYNQGVVLGILKRGADAMASYDRAIELRPRHVDSHYNRGILAGQRNEGESALASFEAALALRPDFPYLLGHALFQRAELCDWRDHAAHVERVKAGTRARQPSTGGFDLLAVEDDPGLHLTAASVHVARAMPAVPPLRPPAPYRHDKIRIAYLSANFCAHAVAYLIAEIFELHDRERFELTAISFGPDDGSPMLARIKATFDRFVDVREMRDDEVAKLIRDAEIDIAVDLMGFTKEGRAAFILAHRPAPIQVNFLGYPGTMGTPFIDYIVADQFIIPPAERAHYSESVVYLPDTYQPNDRKRRIGELVPTRADAGLPETGFVFCSFNNNYKITPAVFDVWMRLLLAVPGSVLWLLPMSDAVRKNLAREAEARGVDASRLIFAPRVDLATHLARHCLADLFLDTLPYNAHTTASDALWTGLPLVTCVGRSFASRVAGSLLHAVGLPELVTTSLAEYETLALRIARDPAYLASLKARLAANRDAARLFDSDRFRRHLEAAYTIMMERHRNHVASSDIVVDPIPEA